MITPNDIETKVFSSSLRGYNKREVDEFLDQIMIDYQALLDQNKKMLERVHVLQKQVAEAKDPAKMTQDAKRLMNDISASAEQKAEVIIKNAKHDAENIVRNAKNSTSQADEDAERLRRKVEKFKLRFKQMLEEEIERVDDNSEDFLDDLRQDFYPTLLYGEKDSDATKVAGAAAIEEDPIADLPDVEPTGGLDEDEPDDQLQDLDQEPDAEEETSEAVSDETLSVEEAEDEEAEKTADEEAEETADETEDSEAEDEQSPAEEPEEDDEEPEEEFEGASTETIVIDRAALAAAQAKLEEQRTEPASDAGQGKVTDETLIIDKAAAEIEAAEFEEYDDPDREEPVEEPEPETEEEQAAKYAADYSGDAETEGGVTDDTIVITDRSKDLKESTEKLIDNLFQKKEN
ncbi:MAG: DivIVA domain-containing protein [Eubacterium sp.]|nr:DivIVA domain-containing protein [Eubacterium sp.]